MHFPGNRIGKFRGAGFNPAPVNAHNCYAGTPNAFDNVIIQPGCFPPGQLAERVIVQISLPYLQQAGIKKGV
jgi:hypothetical protein